MRLSPIIVLSIAVPPAVKANFLSIVRRESSADRILDVLSTMFAP
jgi:hypothetical protein